MSTTVVINEVPKFNLSVQQGDGPAVTLSQPDAPALTLSMSGPQGPTGATGAAGPNSVTTSTSTTLEGYIYGDGTNIAGATEATVYSTASTLMLRDSDGSTAVEYLNIGTFTGGSPTGGYGTLNTDPTGFSGVQLSGAPSVRLSDGTQTLTISSSGIAFESNTITTSQPLSLTQTWSTTNTYKAIDVNITDSGPANAASTLMDLRVGGTSLIKATKAGEISFESKGKIKSFNDGDLDVFNNAGTRTASLGTNGIRSFVGQLLSLSTDVILVRDAATGILAQRNGANAQESRIYGTYTSGTNFERLNLKATGTSFQIGTEKGSTGGVARPLELQTNGTTRATITTVGDLLLTNTWNSSIAVTGASGNGTTATLTFAAQSVAIPVGSTIVVTGVNPSGYNTTGATVTASTTTSVSYANATTTAWVSGGTIQQLFTAIRADITDTASAADSYLIDLRADNTSKFRVTTQPTTGTNTNGFRWEGVNNGGLFSIDVNGNTASIAPSGGHDVHLANGYVVVFRGGVGNGVRIGTSGNGPRIFYDEDRVLAQRNGTNAQVTRIYDTYTSATDYHRLAIATARATASAMTGATVTLTNIIPAGAVVVGVTCKVTTAITGATSFDIGTATDVDRFGAAIAVALGTTSDNRNWTAGTVECFPAATSLILTANGSNFTGGAVYVSVQYLSGQAD